MSESMFGMMFSMLGLDPAQFQQQAGQVIAAILEARIRCERIEAKLDALLDKLDPEQTIARRPPVAFLPGVGSGAGPGNGADATPTLDARSSEPPPPHEPHIGNAAGIGGGAVNAEWRPYGVAR